MITQETMTTTEIILMSYFFDTSDWLMGRKSINQELTQARKEELTQLLKKDADTLSLDKNTAYEDDLMVTIAALEEMTEAQFQETKVTILSWEPVKEF
ncbi:hypothetical protein [Streptococcus agalactiae]|uniref:hypothetical protein n=1 Tax=Streptococcus agalactiae TaxID=1311 RepID=UPI001868D5F3|nr:hypothetical protein [Streptococcus agalactiae]MBE3600752.1 hypothetical protein [Streptococcus agalactiae]